jgi:hypothetical protein
MRPMKLRFCFQVIFSIIVSIFQLITPDPNVQAETTHPESWYQEQWCNAASGQMEVELPDGTRPDCVTETHVIEFDFGDKFYEAIGQSLHYSLQSGRRAGIVLILETQADRRYWDRLTAVIHHFNLPIDAWSTGELTEYYQGGGGAQCASFDFSSNILHIPCLSVGNTSYWIDMGLISSGPVRFELRGSGRIENSQK